MKICNPGYYIPIRGYYSWVEKNIKEQIEHE